MKRAASAVGGGLGCLALLAATVIVAFGVLAIFLDDPTFWIAVVALTVAVSAAMAANKVRKRGR